MKRFLYDTSVFVYARSAEHEHREACRAVIRLAQQGVLAGEASVELVQEYAHILRTCGLNGAEVRDQVGDVAALCLLHAFTEEDLQLALNLMATHPALRMRDAIHAATALRRGIPTILSADRDFDRISGLERIDPNDAIRLLGLGPPEAS